MRRAARPLFLRCNVSRLHLFDFASVLIVSVHRVKSICRRHVTPWQAVIHRQHGFGGRVSDMMLNLIHDQSKVVSQTNLLDQG